MQCPPDKVRNPKTGRCVSKTGKIGRSIPASDQTTRPGRSCPTDCQAIGKLCNPASGRCVTKTGVIGKLLMVRDAPVKLAIKVQEPSVKLDLHVHDEHEQATDALLRAERNKLQMKSNMTNLQTSYARLLSNLDSKTYDLERVRSELEAYEAAIAEADRRLADSAEELRATKERADAANAKLARLEASRTGSAEELRAAKERADAANAKIKTIEKTLRNTSDIYEAILRVATDPEMFRLVQNDGSYANAVRSTPELKKLRASLFAEDRARRLGFSKAPIRIAQNIEKAFEDRALASARSTTRRQCEAAQARVAEAERRLRDAEREMALLRVRGLSTASTAANQAKIRNLEEMIKTQESTIRNLQQVAAVCRQQQDAMAQKNETHRRELAARNEAHRQRIDELMANQTRSQRQRNQELRREHESALRARNEAHRQRIDELMANQARSQSARIRELRGEHESALRARNEAHRQRIDELMANQTRSQRQRIQELRGEHEREMQQLRVQAELNARLRVSSRKRASRGATSQPSKRPFVMDISGERAPRQNSHRAGRRRSR